MQTIPKCTLDKYLKIIPGERGDYGHLSRFHYCGPSCGPIIQVYKLIDDHLWRGLRAPVVGIIIYGAPSANLAARNRATGGMFGGLDRAEALALLNERLLCIRRVIIEPRYRGLGLAGRLVRETLPLTGSPMIEAISVMGRSHPFFQRAGMTAFESPPDAKTERMQAALETAGLGGAAEQDSASVHTAIEGLRPDLRAFILGEMARFCQKFTNRRHEAHSPERTDFVLSKLSHRPAYYLWTRLDSEGTHLSCAALAMRETPR